MGFHFNIEANPGAVGMAGSEPAEDAADEGHVAPPFRAAGPKRVANSGCKLLMAWGRVAAYCGLRP